MILFGLLQENAVASAVAGARVVAAAGAAVASALVAVAAAVAAALSASQGSFIDFKKQKRWFTLQAAILSRTAPK